MLSFVSTLCALVSSAVLLIAVADHVAAPSSLRGALVSQAILPPGLSWVVTGAVIAAEGGLALAVGTAVLVGDRGQALLRPALTASVLLFSLYAAYTGYLVARRADVPCGCSRHDLEVDGWVVARAVACMVIAAAALWQSDKIIGVSGSGARFAIAAAAALTFAVLLWHAPLALQDPVRQVLRRGRSQMRALGRKETMA